MSLVTWKKKFYPTEARTVRGKVNCAEHSLRKWRGLLKSNLRGHGVTRTLGRFISDRNDYDMEIDDQTCALCQQYMNHRADAVCCPGCPLSQTLNQRCDWREDSPYIVWLRSGDARPMVRALKRTLKMLKKEAKEA